MKIKIVYFACLVPNKWEPIVEEQLTELKQSNLYNDAIQIYMSVISDDVELEKLKVLLRDKYNKVNIINVFKDNVYEYDGIKAIYQIDDNIILQNIRLSNILQYL